MSDIITQAQIEEAAEGIRRHTKQRPTIGLILGSGLAGLADDINNGGKVAYPVIEETKKNVRTKKAPASEPKLEEGNEIDSNCEDIDLDNADINYDDINIEDLAEA